MKVSVIIPVYNEEKVIGGCLLSLAKQNYSSFEVIVVDDGSSDSTLTKIQGTGYKIHVLQQKHLGPGAARNLGAKQAKGDILVFVDADMEFAPDFIEKLTLPILSHKFIGTFSKDEYLLNKENIWARLWNINLGRHPEKMEPQDFSQKSSSVYLLGKRLLEKFEHKGVSLEKDRSHVFRAISKNEFIKAGGFDINTGYTDDWSISEKLVTKSVVAPGAKFYHRNPETLFEVWNQARWFGKNEFLTRNFVRRLYNLFRYCPILAIFKIYDRHFFVFKFVYNLAVFTSIVLSFFGENKNK